VIGEDEEFAHGANGTMTVVPRKTARSRWIPSYYEFATHTMIWKMLRVAKQSWQQAQCAEVNGGCLRGENVHG